MEKELVTENLKQFVEIEREVNGGTQLVFKFPNNRGASIVQHSFSYGTEEGLFELAVIKWNGDIEWNLDYSTEITDDVLGSLTAEECMDYSNKIKELPDNPNIIGESE